ncbi:HlyD family secretion protein [Caldinitratiruptor microaerophilus]|uniref:Hemolysin secretion protein D n=1 Tax=Caldinitratiruptor microaerophilus TaxID=671077 RepID=A0AA35G5A0_9FIRM|nr:HlyD family efflux transporter periplasmic adaptor subunit [Caldinitratiruptor microaerophilus]BDG59011.1 hemolysin secretion protein D [Caldinitratiruptor microaerophilus]
MTASRSSANDRSLSRRIPRSALLAASVVLAVTALSACARTRAPRPLTASGTVEADTVRVAAEVGGRVLELGAREGEVVRAGQVVARLDSRLAEARVQEAEAALATARARYEEAAGGTRDEVIRQARAALDQARVQRDAAARERDRLRALVSGGAATAAQLDQAEDRLRAADKALAAAQAAYDQARAGATRAALAVLERAVEQAEAAVKLARLQADLSTVRAPVDGVVSAELAHPGEVVAPGAPLVEIVDTRRLWVRVYIPEADLVRLRTGQPAEVRVDGLPDRRFPASVRWIAPEAEFTPRNVQTPSERTRIVFAVKVAVTDPEGHLKPGLPADVTFLDVGAAPPPVGGPDSSRGESSRS